MSSVTFTALYLLQRLKTGSQATVEKIVRFLSSHIKTIITSEGIAQVATISANVNSHVDDLTATATEKFGKEGVITIKGGKTIEDEIEITEQMRFDRGFISPYFVADLKWRTSSLRS
jgi:chaperonin GroEL